MKISAGCLAFVVLFLFESCLSQKPLYTNYFSKDLFNSNWRQQGVGEQEWYYRATVIDAPSNTSALSIADGHVLHPETIRFEITEHRLIGWRAHASVLNADHEMNPDVKKNYRGAPIVVYPIREHFDLSSDSSLGSIKNRPWYLRKFMTIDFSQNLVTELSRNDGDEGIFNAAIYNGATHVVEEELLSDPKRLRRGENFFEFTSRHPISTSMAAYQGKHGVPFKEDGAAVVLDIRHFFLKKPVTDFVPLHYPDQIAEFDDGSPVKNNQGKIKRILINKRFGMFRTNFDGRLQYNDKNSEQESVVNATIFNIWQKSREGNHIIPVEEREIKPIIYYTNVLHPEDLMSTSFKVAKLWDRAFREVIFHVQPKKFASQDDVPPVFILKKNNCEIDNVSLWLEDKHLQIQVETAARVKLDTIKMDLDRSQNPLGEHDWSNRNTLEIQAKRQLEQICSALEFYTKDLSEPFVYQRLGDLRFNLLNLHVENNFTPWSGYGPMFADSITGEIIAANANINLKYIDLRSWQLAKQIGLLTDKFAKLKAVFGEHVIQDEAANKKIDAMAITTRERLRNLSYAAPGSFSFVDLSQMASGISFSEQSTMESITKALASSVEMTRQGAHKNYSDAKNGMMDPLRFIDDMSIGIALKCADLPRHQCFLKIRQAIYKSVALHEIGHNIGLRHNMAGASDPLNYSQDFWSIANLPTDLKEARSLIKDPKKQRELDACIEQAKKIRHAKKFSRASQEITTQDCLQEKEKMYASIMDYHASALSGSHGLGHYDLAAIKFVYGQIIEKFPLANIAIDLDKISLARWLKLNNYRDIGGDLLKNTEAIHERIHEKFSWDHQGSKHSYPKNAVPYSYCDDPTGNDGPRCLAFDFGPTMQASAQWLKTRFLEQFIASHFAQDHTWSINSSLPATAIDIDILNRFTHILRWYYRNLKEDEDFAGSYAEQDYLRAIATGLNHFAHVIGLPEPGAHVSAPTWVVEDREALSINANRLTAANYLIPLNSLSHCSAEAITSTNSDGKIVGRLGYHYFDVPLGMGRPLHFGFHNELEERFILYHGSLLAKKYALYLLSAPLITTKSMDQIEKNDAINMTWYRLFPEAVGKIYADIIGKRYDRLGLWIDETGDVQWPNIIDEKTLQLKNHKRGLTILPAMDESLPIFAIESAASNIPLTISQESNLLNSMKISRRDSSNDINYGDDKTLVRYVHLTGQEYLARQISETSIGALLLIWANRQKERYLKLNECVDDEEVRKNDPFCHCIQTMHRKSFDQWQCCNENNEDCNQAELVPTGTGLCSMQELIERKNQNFDQLDAVVGYIDNLRKLMKEPSP